MKRKILIFLSIILALTFIIGMQVSFSAAELQKAGIVTTASGSLNVRSTASAASVKLTTLAKGSYITLAGKTGDWWKVEYSPGKYGYCSAAYIKEVNSSLAYVNITGGMLNVRSGAGTSYSINATLLKGTEVLVLSDNNGWKYILFNGTQTGYANSNYIKIYGQSSTTPTTPSNAAVYLSVPSFKQTDSRWSGEYIGNSGQTIGQIGCLTTAVAMVESYRTNTTIYPNVMESRLSYSSSGSLYWPTDYTAYFGSDYLAKIYSELKSGKPAILGMKNNYGGMHWVVVTGFKGGDLVASNFLVNDPGSREVDLMNEFFAKYPVFYKLVTYNN